jgi:uncharacterized protein (TIGR03437 family)
MDSYLFTCAAPATNSKATGNAATAPICTPAPITVSQGTPVMVLYGTGIRNRANLSNVMVSVGGLTLPALYAGPAAAFPAIDQVNVALPPSLGGSGTVFVTVSVSNTGSNPTMTSNPVAVMIQ